MLSDEKEYQIFKDLIITSRPDIDIRTCIPDDPEGFIYLIHLKILLKDKHIRVFKEVEILIESKFEYLLD